MFNILQVFNNRKHNNWEPTPDYTANDTLIIDNFNQHTFLVANIDNTGKITFHENKLRMRRKYKVHNPNNTIQIYLKYDDELKEKLEGFYAHKYKNTNILPKKHKYRVFKP